MSKIILKRTDNDELDFTPVLKLASKKIKNRFSGNYISPTFTKGWMDCPSRQLIQNVAVDNKPKSSAAILGTMVHLMYQHMQSEWVPESHRDILTLWSKEAKPHHKADFRVLSYEGKADVLKKTLWYVEQYLGMDDYIEGTGHKLKDVWKLDGVQVQNEFFMRVQNFELFKQILPTLTNLLDRLDFRDDDIYVIDYKSGTENSGDHLLQMMIYSWGVQKLYGVKPKCLIISPGAPKKVTEVTWTKRDESKALESILQVNVEAKAALISGIYPVRENKWCQYCIISEACLSKKPEIEIEINEERISQK